ncbi:MAG: OmpA family protein [Bacteroidota bacterium]
MKISHLALLLCCLPFWGRAQNLVPNPSFERVNAIDDRWSSTYYRFEQHIQDWTSPTQGSPDLLFVQYLGKMLPKRPYVDLSTYAPRTGKFMLGIKTYGCLNQAMHCKEYIQTKLTQTLEAGREYYFEFWLRPLNNSSKVNGFGIALSVTDATQRHVLGHFDVSPAYLSTKVVQQQQWQKISGTFIANDNYQFLLIGNFLKDQSITVEDEHEELDYGFYLLDDVLLQPLTSDTTHSFAQQPFALEHLLFEFNQAELPPSSFPELDQLAQHLQDSPTTTITITGHTDNEGTAAYNLELSQKRAEAVKAYLAAKGVAPKRMVTIGKGSTVPLAQNDNEGNRQLNRRVEVNLQE